MTQIIVDNAPNDLRAFVGNVEFYITNVCNLTCSNCNRFNNYDFKGWQRWSDYEADYTEWAQKVRLQKITILGGEPFLNPTLGDWVEGINRLWDRRVQILTNGTRLNHTPGLYNRIVGWQGENPSVKNWIGISLHNENDLERCFDEIKKFLQGNITHYRKTDPDNIDNANTWGADHAFVDSNGMHVHVWLQDSFYLTAIHKNADNRFALYDNPPELAHKACGFVQHKCYHFIKGRLYKCGPVALFPEFDSQFNFDLSDSDRNLLNSYQPLTVQDFDTRGKDFLDHIDDVILQCKFCYVPREGYNFKLNSVSKKAGATSIYD